MVGMPRQTREELDAEIVDRAAALFARQGYQQTTVQRIAEAVGFYKTGLMQPFPNKEALRQAVVDGCLAEMRAVGDGVGDLPPGPVRDRAAVAAFVDLALRKPGFIALMLGNISSPDAAFVDSWSPALGDTALAAFAVEPGDVERGIRVVGAFGAIVFSSIAVPAFPLPDARSLLTEIGYAALGHDTPAAP